MEEKNIMEKIYFKINEILKLDIDDNAVLDIARFERIYDYVVKQVEWLKVSRKMDFIIRKKDKLEIGDKVLCINEGYAFKYNQES